MACGCGGPEWTRRRAHLQRALRPSKPIHHHHHPHERRHLQLQPACRPPPVVQRIDFGPVAWPTGTATRAILTGFDDGLSAHDLAADLEDEAGTVWRCRVKTSVTPPESYPDFKLPVRAAAADDAAVFRQYQKDEPSRHGRVAPHAFVHFEHPNAADCAGESFRTRPGGHNTYQLHGRAARPRNCGTDDDDDEDNDTRRQPMLFPDSRVEVGDVVAPGTFLVAWRGGTDDSDSDPAAASALGL